MLCTQAGLFGYRQREDGEKLYSLYLREPVRNWRDADHLPVRVAKEVLKHEDIKRFEKCDR
ncbi:hypothetical protein [Chlorogloeopsis sp. ULAP02]|uniref:hypothetical protein n=1 Tax=Chlorogloeopsis sp. ULAP02 TaxID=3107926 RepID=UPI003136192B